MTHRRTLIVNADDYGLTAGISRGILAAHRQGVVTSTSVLALGPALPRTVGWLRDTDGIGVGAHLAAVGEDPPLLSAREVPTLVDRRGRLARSWRRFLPRMAAGRIDPEDLRRELRSQVELLQAHGLRPDHVDTHQHLHLWPPVADVVVKVAVEAGIPAIRVPRSAAGSPVGWAVRHLAARLEDRAGAAGLAFPGASAGLDEAGALDHDRLRRAIDRLGAGGADSAEIGAHPGASHDPERDRYRWGYRWAHELAALTAPETRDHVTRAGFALGCYRDLLAGAAR